MFRIYFDKQIFSYLFNEKLYKNGLSKRSVEKYAVLYDKVFQHKDQFVFYFSEAHMQDLSRDKTEIKYEELDFMESIVDRNCIAIIKNKPTSYLITPKEGFDEFSQINVPDFDNLNFNEMSDDQLKAIANAVEILTKNTKGDLAPNWLDTRKPIENMDLVMEILKDSNNIMTVSQFTTEYPQKYKVLRDLITSETNSKKKLDIDSGLLESVGLPFSGFITQALKQIGLEQHNELQYYVAIYSALDMLGIEPERRRTLKFENMMADARHSYFASFCDCFVVNDEGLVRKTKKIYNQIGLKTKVLSIDEFIKELDKIIEVSQMSSDEFVHTLIDTINKLDIISNESNNESELTLFKEFNTDYIGYFNVPMLLRREEGTFIVLKRDNVFGSCFISFEEIKIISNKIALMMPVENKESYHFFDNVDLEQLRQQEWNGKHWLFEDIEFSLIVENGGDLLLLIRIKDEMLLKKITCKKL